MVWFFCFIFFCFVYNRSYLINVSRWFNLICQILVHWGWWWIIFDVKFSFSYRCWGSSIQQASVYLIKGDPMWMRMKVASWPFCPLDLSRSVMSMYNIHDWNLSQGFNECENMSAIFSSVSHLSLSMPV